MYVEHRRGSLEHAYCVPLDAFGPIDEETKIPQNIKIFIEKLAINLNNRDWLVQIQTVRSRMIPSAHDMIAILKRNANDVTTNEMILAVAQVFNMQSYCHFQHTVEYLIDFVGTLDRPCE